MVATAVASLKPSLVSLPVVDTKMAPSGTSSPSGTRPGTSLAKGSPVFNVYSPLFSTIQALAVIPSGKVFEPQ